MSTYFIACLATLIVFVAIDFVWLSSMASRFYRPLMGDNHYRELRSTATNLWAKIARA